MSDAVAIEEETLLTDAELLGFIAQGYHLIEPELPAGFHETICEQIDALESNPGNDILARVPMLQTGLRPPSSAWGARQFAGRRPANGRASPFTCECSG